jgi:hypothetical protein
MIRKKSIHFSADTKGLVIIVLFGLVVWLVVLSAGIKTSALRLKTSCSVTELHPSPIFKSVDLICLVESMDLKG